MIGSVLVLPLDSLAEVVLWVGLGQIVGMLVLAAVLIVGRR